MVATTPSGVKPVTTTTWGLFYEPTTLDWTKAYAVAENETLANMCENLLRLTPTFGIQPALASSYSHPNLLTWVFQIRQGVKFWNGQEMTPTDVVYSLDRSLSPSSFWNNPFMVNVASVKQTGPWQVTVTLKRPDAMFLESMALPAGGVGEKNYIVAKGNNYGTPQGGVMCTGPFEFKSWQKGVSITLDRNPNYWDTSHRALSEQIVFKFIGNESTRTSALESGAIAGTHFVPTSAIKSLQSAGGTFSNGLSMWTEQIVATQRKGPLANPLIRHALSMAINRQQIATAVFSGEAAPVKALDPPASWSYAKNIFQSGYNALPALDQNLAAAKALVKKAGSPTAPITIGVAAETGGEVAEAQLVQSWAGQVGLNVKIAEMPSSEYVNFFFNPSFRAKYDAFFSFGYPDIADPLETYVLLLPGAINNFSNYNNPAVVKETNQARQTESPTARAQMLVAVQKQVMQDLPDIPLVTVPWFTYQGPAITGAVPSQSMLYAPWATQIGTK
jgi:peptide/nickel transport system substrate-binding protein